MVALAGVETWEFSFERHYNSFHVPILTPMRVRHVALFCVTSASAVPCVHRLFRSFLDDVGEALLISAAHPTETVVCGDFNTRYGDPTCTDATNLADLLGTSGFVQHVKGSTHVRGNILDLVITSESSHVIASAVKPTTMITDHYAIECELHQPKPMRLKRHVEYLRYAAIDNSWFAADLAAADFNAPELDSTALLYRYDYCLRAVVDEHAPLVSRTITVRPMTPWHTSELAEDNQA